MPREFHKNRPGYFLLKSESNKWKQNEWRNDAHWWFIGLPSFVELFLLFAFDMLSHIA